MSVTRLVAVLRHRWPIVLTLAVVGAVLGYGATYLVTPSYTSTMKLYVSGTGLTSTDRLQSGEYARSRVSSYSDMIGSADVLDAVRGYLGLPPTGESALGDIATSVTATNPLDTSVIDVTVQASDPQQARQVGVAIGAVADGVIGRLESPPDGAQSPVRLSVASPPTLPLYRDSPSGRVYAAGGLAAGALLGLGLASLLDTRRARRARQRLVVQPPPQPAGPWTWWPTTGGRPTARPSTASSKRSSMESLTEASEVA